MIAINPPTRTNRILLGIIGLGLLAVGCFELLFALSPLGQRIPALSVKAPLLRPNLVPPPWLPWLGAVLCLIVGLLLVRWLAAQLRRRPQAQVWRLPTDPGKRRQRDTGRILLDTGHAATAVATEVAGYPEVANATAVLAGPRLQPELLLVVHTEPGADLDELRDRIHEHALVRLRAALELTDLPTRLLIHLDSDLTVRVR